MNGPPSSRPVTGESPAHDVTTPDGSPRLVYCEGPWAYFTTRPDWQNQWGDDWNDEPYEHNAGTPYTWRDYMAERGVPPYEIVQVAWDGADLDLPLAQWLNSPYSVESINKGAVAWLRSPEYRRTSGVVIDIWAGTTLREFIAAINGDGGTVYMAMEGQRPHPDVTADSAHADGTS